MAHTKRQYWVKLGLKPIMLKVRFRLPSRRAANLWIVPILFSHASMGASSVLSVFAGTGASVELNPRDHGHAHPWELRPRRVNGQREEPDLP